jgi:uncharacterized protein YhfF
VTDGQIDAFWCVARSHTRTDRSFADLGTLGDEANTPAAFAFGATPAEADELLALVLEGTKTATAGALWDYEHEGETLPRAGDLEILLDGAQRPRGLVEVTQVEVVAFDEVSPEHARLEGEGDLSLAYWRDVHERFFAEVATHGRGFVRTMPVVLQRFRVLYSQ